MTWMPLLLKEMKQHGESWSDAQDCTLSYEELCAPFPASFAASGPAFTLWTERRVYFPAYFEGDEWVASVPRNPCDEATEPVGGG